MKNIHPALKTNLYKQACSIIESGSPVELFSEASECVYVTCFRDTIKAVFKNSYDDGEPITKVDIATDACITFCKNVYYVNSHIFLQSFWRCNFPWHF